MAEKSNGSKFLIVFRCAVTALLALIATGAIFLSTSVYSGTIDRTKIDMRLERETTWRKAHECSTKALAEKRQAAEIRDVKMYSSIEKIKEDVSVIKFQLASSKDTDRSSIPTDSGSTP